MYNECSDKGKKEKNYKKYKRLILEKNIEKKNEFKKNRKRRC